MKIGIITEYFYPTLGGITENVYHFSRELLSMGHEFCIITGGAKDRGPLDPAVSQRIIPVGKTMYAFFNGSNGCATVGFGLRRKIKEILAAEQFDLIHLHSPLFPTLPLIANIQATIPVVGTFHTCMGDHFFYRFKCFRERSIAMLSRMNGRIAVSECCARENQQHFDFPFDIIPNGVDVEWWVKDARKIDRLDDGKVNILFLGRPDTRNGLDALIRAFVPMHRRFPDTRLIIVGDGPLRFYFERLVPHDLKQAVSFEGAAHDTRPDYAATADIFCFLPTIASFGITILEGMSAGKAIIASDIEAFRELLTHEESALLVPTGDDAALERALCRLIEDGKLRQTLGANAAMRVTHFDWKRVAKLQVEYYERILGHGRSDAARLPLPGTPA